MSTRRMSFILALVLAAAVATPAAAADLDSAELTQLDIFAKPAPNPAEPVPALQPGVAAEARSSCSEGQKTWIWTTYCCTLNRQEQEQHVCTGGTWVPTGNLRCAFPACN